MSTFQAIIYGLITGFSQFLPISSVAHEKLIPYFLGWPEPQGPALGALTLGALLALIIYFRHDWASICSSLVQVILFRKKPMTLDERMSFFLGISALPVAGVTYYLKEHPLWDTPSPLVTAAVLTLFTVPLLFFDSFSRRNRGMFDWNCKDALLVGLGQIFSLIPGGGRMEGALTVSFSRNYNRVSAVKFALYASAPLLGMTVFTHLHGLNFRGGPPADLNWLSFGMAIVISCLTGLLALGGLMKHIERGNLKQYGIYRLLLAALTFVLVWQRY